MVFFEVGCFELRQEGDQLIKNDVFSVGNLFDQNEIDRSLIPNEEGGFLLLEGIAFPVATIDDVQIDDVPHPEDRISHLIAITDSLSLGVQVELLE